MKDALITLGDGRELAYTDIGDPGGPCVLFFHGAPTSRLRIALMEDDFVARGLRAISPDRPGYGGSSPQPGRSLTDWPEDVEALADKLGIERFAVAGHSSGGPYAVVCAAMLGSRVLAGMTLAGVTDMRWPAAWDGYPDFEIPMMRQPDEQAAIAWSAEQFGEDGSAAIEEFGLPASDPRRAPLVEAFRQGVVGYAQDIFVQGRGWTFDPASITVRVDVTHGEDDQYLPVAHSRHTAELIPTSTFRCVRGRDHFSILAELPTAASTLLRSV